MEYYSALKKIKMLSFAIKWMGLQTIMFSKISQPQKDKSHMFFLIYGNLYTDYKKRECI